VRTLAFIEMKHSRPPDLKSSSNVSLPFAWITGPRKRTQLFRIHILKLKKIFRRSLVFLLAKTVSSEMTTFYQYIYFLELSKLLDVWPNDPILTPNYQNEKEVHETM
jgi:hypothetical protein